MQLILVRPNPWTDGYVLAYQVEDDVYEVLRERWARLLRVGDNEPQELAAALHRLRTARRNLELRGAPWARRTSTDEEA